MAGQRRAEEEGSCDRAAPPSHFLPYQELKRCLFSLVVLACVMGSCAQQTPPPNTGTLLENLLCRAGLVNRPVQAGLFFEVCTGGVCQTPIQPTFSNGRDTINITAPVHSEVRFKVRFEGWPGAQPMPAITVQPTRLMSRVTLKTLADETGPYTLVSWFNSTSDISIPYNCLNLVLDPVGQCAFTVCRKDCATPVFILNHLALDYMTLGGTGTRDSPIVLEKRLKTQVGEPISFILKLRNTVLPDIVDIEGRVDGGIPIGMEFGAKQMEGTTTTTREVTWTPHKGQQGYEHIAHFVGWNCPPAGDTVPCEVAMVYLDIVFNVELPLLTWYYPDNALNGGSIPPQILTQHVVVGQKTEIELACRAADTSSSPHITLLNASIDGELTDGTPRTGAMGNAGWEFVYDEVDPDTDRRRLLRFDFTPALGDEGGEKQWCFNCGDAQDLGGINARCITLFTRLCRVAVAAGDTLQTVTRRYHLDRNWRRLWNTNPHIPNPYVELHAGSALQIGPVYRVRPADTLASIAARFETTVKKVLMVNPHLGEVDAHELPVGLDMCVLPCTNKPPPSHFIGTKLLDSADNMAADMATDRQ